MKSYFTLNELLANKHNTPNNKPAKLAVIGNPIVHSKSPQMQQAALDAANINARYIRILTTPAEFPELIRQLPMLGFIGVNITVPFKQTAFTMCHSLDALAQLTGAVNTIVFKQDGTLQGFNTDGPGFIRAIREMFSLDLRDLKIVLLGACGGAGSSLAATCALQRCERLTLAGRDETKLQTLKTKLASFFIDEHRLEGTADRLTAHINNTPHLYTAISEADLIVNATSLGLNATDPSPIPTQLIQAHHLIYDLQTHADALQADAQLQGARIANGLSMLVHQGVLAFEHWFGHTPNLELMWNALKQPYD